MSLLIAFIFVVVFATLMEFGESYERKIERHYKRTSEDVNFNRHRCKECGK